MVGKVAAYAEYGVILRNDQWSWSGRTPDGDVVITCWQDHFDYRAKPAVYSCFNSPTLEQWKRLPGNRERLEHLRYARDHRGGRLRVVIAKAVNPNVEPRKIEECFPRRNMVLRLTELNEETGEFSAYVLEAK